MWSKLPEASGSMVRHEPWLKIPELFLAALLPCAPTPRKNDSWSDPRSRGTRRKKKKKKKKNKKGKKKRKLHTGMYIRENFWPVKEKNQKIEKLFRWEKLSWPADARKESGVPR